MTFFLAYKRGYREDSFDRPLSQFLLAIAISNTERPSVFQMETPIRIP